MTYDMSGGTFNVSLIMVVSDISDEEATTDKGEHESPICDKYYMFNLFSCTVKLYEDCTQRCWLFLPKKSKRMRSNTDLTAFLGSRSFGVCPARPRTQTIFPDKWQIPIAQQSHGIEYNNEFEKENDDTLEENYMTVYVKMSYGKTISRKYNRNWTAAVLLDEVERRSSIPRDMTYLVHKGKMLSEKETMKEHMNEQMDIHETGYS